MFLRRLVISLPWRFDSLRARVSLSSCDESCREGGRGGEREREREGERKGGRERVGREGGGVGEGGRGGRDDLHIPYILKCCVNRKH